MNRTYTGVKLPNADLSDITGKLIVIEGTDGVGRSTQINDIKEWLEVKGYAVMVTGWIRSPFIGKAVQDAKERHTLNVQTFSLLYLADFADRLEHEIIPALKAGYTVLADRYIYTAFVRSLIRGLDRDWLVKSYGFALVPDAVFYMRVKVKELIPRILNSENMGDEYWKNTDKMMDFWESGMDMRLGEDFYDSFIQYQKKAISLFDEMAKEYNFTVVDASRKFSYANKALKEGIAAVVGISE
jgi:dTMP kinase